CLRPQSTYSMRSRISTSGGSMPWSSRASFRAQARIRSAVGAVRLTIRKLRSGILEDPTHRSAGLLAEFFVEVQDLGAAELGGLDRPALDGEIDRAVRAGDVGELEGHTLLVGGIAGQRHRAEVVLRVPRLGRAIEQEVEVAEAKEH